MTDWCMPWWHNQLTTWAGDRRLVTECKVETSATAQFPLARFVPCPPEQLRTEAEARMRTLGVWPNDQPLPMIVYALARVIASEAAQGSIEERVVVAETILNESARTKTDPVTLLISNKADRPFFGGAGQDRFAVTDKDPSVGDVLTAAFIASGQTQNFSRGATAYVRPNQINNDSRLIAFLGDKFGSGKWGWVGHYPNVHIRRLFALKPVTAPLVDQITRNQKGLADLRAGQNPPLPETTCPGPTDKRPTDWKKIGTVAVITVVGSLLAAGTSYAIAETSQTRWKEWEPKESPRMRPELPPAPPIEPSTPGAS